MPGRGLVDALWRKIILQPVVERIDRRRQVLQPIQCWAEPNGALGGSTPRSTNIVWASTPIKISLHTHLRPPFMRPLARWKRRSPSQGARLGLRTFAPFLRGCLRLILLHPQLRDALDQAVRHGLVQWKTEIAFRATVARQRFVKAYIAFDRGKYSDVGLEGGEINKNSMAS
jgi:hypothetical protein